MNYYPYSSPYGAQNRAQYGVPSYGGYNYTPQSQQMPVQPQNQPQAQQPITQHPQQIQEFRHGTEDEIRPIIIYPNCVAYHIDYAKGRMYAKRADSAGVPTIEYYALTPINEDGSPLKPQEQPTQPDFKDFVKLSDMNTFGFTTMSDIKSMGFATMEQVEKLSQKIDALQNQRTGVKQNVGTNKPQV